MFAVCYALGALLASFAPDVWNTEKPMDMAFITAINASTQFPPHDPWMSGESLNYYYLGHMVLAWPIELLGLRPGHGLPAGLGRAARPDGDRGLHVRGHAVGRRARDAGERAPRGGPVFAGLVAAALVAILGNLAGVRSWISAADPPRDYAWFDPSRVIPDTINEFPSFSFLLGDLHAHVLALPFTVLALAFAMQVALNGPRGDLLWRAVAEALAAGLAVGMLYAINSWSYPVAAGILAAAVITWIRGGGPRGFPLVWLGLVLVASFVLIAPFVLELRPRGARDRLRARAARRSATWLGDHALIYGILIWPLLAAIVIRLREAQHTLALDRLGRRGLRRRSARCWPPTT